MNATPNNMPKKKRTPVPPLELKTPEPKPKPAFVRKEHLTDRSLKAHPGLINLRQQLRLPNTRNK